MKVATGMVFGKLTIRAVYRSSKQGPVNMRKKCRVECACGNLVTIPVYYLIRKAPKTSCGKCNPRSLISHYPEEYRIWNMMHERTENPKHVSFVYYGGRGIRVCEDWQKHRDDGEGFAEFLRFVGPRPSPSHSIDRVNNNVGYQPYHEGRIQVKWSTAKEQRANQRPGVNTLRSTQGEKQLPLPAGDTHSQRAT